MWRPTAWTSRPTAPSAKRLSRDCSTRMPTRWQGVPSLAVAVWPARRSCPTGTGWVIVIRYSDTTAVALRAVEGEHTEAKAVQDAAGLASVVGRFTTRYSQAAWQAATPGWLLLPSSAAAASAMASAAAWSAFLSRCAPLMSSTRATSTSRRPMDAAKITITAPRSSRGSSPRRRELQTTVGLEAEHDLALERER